MTTSTTTTTTTTTSSWCRLVFVWVGIGYWMTSLAWTILLLQQKDDPTTVPSSSSSLQHFQHSFVRCPSTSIDEFQNETNGRIISNNKGTTHPLQKQDGDLAARSFTGVDTTTINNSKKTSKKKKKKPLDPNWWKHYVDRLTRTWQARSMDSWCAPPMITTHKPPRLVLSHQEVATGMIYIKLYKASSSTCEGIARSIAHHVGVRQQQQQQQHQVQANNTTTTSSYPFITCPTWTRHEFANNRMHARRDVSQSLLWTFVRNPAARDLSHVYHFEIGRKQKNHDTLNIQQHIQQLLKGRQTRYLVPQKTSPAPLWPLHELRKNRTWVVDYMAQHIMDNYDFLGLTERMNESLACMVLLWGLQPQDVIVLNAKRSGGYDDGGGGIDVTATTGTEDSSSSSSSNITTTTRTQCTKIPKAVLTPQLEEYFQTNYSLWNADVLLYHAANASLERTMDALGREKVGRLAQHIQTLQDLAQDACQDQAYFPCSPTGIFQPDLAAQSCYVQDSGCGHECVDRVLSSSSISSFLTKEETEDG